MKIAIGISTYNRPQELIRVLKNIIAEKGTYDLHIAIFNDGSDVDYADFIQFKNTIDEDIHYSLEKHHGKPYYWQLITKMYQHFKAIDYDYFIQLPDDISVIKDFFSKAIIEYDFIDDPKKIALNLLFDGRIDQVKWVNCKADDLGFVYKTGWLDMCFIAKKEFFTTLSHTINPVELKWSGDKQKSSGVGKQISQRLFDAGKTIYLVKNTMVLHDDHVSVMHKETRKIHKLIAKERVVAGMASFPDRNKNVVTAALSLINQVDELHIYLNGYNQIPSGLLHKKIKCFLSKKHNGDLGDAGKFFSIDNFRGYFLSVDDDLMYPPTYVQDMLDGIEKFQRKAIVTHHGRNLHPHKIANYYHKSTPRIYRCLEEVEKETIVQIGGTGVTAFHTDTINVRLGNFEIPNMADIWLAKLSQEQNVSIVCLKHKKGYIKQQIVKQSSSIAIKYKCNNEHITKTVNSINWRNLKMTQNSKPIQIVIPYVCSKDTFEALRFALRSIETHCKFEHEIVIIGELPPFILPEKVRFIAQKRIEYPEFSTQMDQNKKLNTILLDPQTTDNFIITYDDVYFLKDTTVEDLENLKCCLKQPHVPKIGIHSLLVKNTIDALKMAKIEGRNCETHLPRFINKDSMIAVFQKFLPLKNRLKYFTLYFNTIVGPDNLTELSKKDDIKAGFYGMSDDWSFGDAPAASLLKTIKKRTYLNHNDAGLSPNLVTVIKELFPTPSQYEVIEDNNEVENAKKK